MGGFGSGGHNTSGAATCESCPSIDLAWLRRRGHTEPRSLLDAGLVAREKFASFRRGASRERSCSEACSSRPRPLLVTLGTTILAGSDATVPSAAKPNISKPQRQSRQDRRGGPEPEPDRPKAMHSMNDNGALRTIMTSHRCFSHPIRLHRLFPPVAGAIRERAGPSAGWRAQRATRWRGSERRPRPCRRWSAGTDPHSRPRRSAPRSI